MNPHRAHAGLILRHAEPVMGTVVSFDLRPQGLAFTQTRQALREACAQLHEVDRVFSLYRNDSPLQRVRHRRLALHDALREISEVLALCDHARTLSDGAFDPWALPGGVDPTGLVKGWAAEQAAAILKHAGVGAAMINAAGDITTFGRPTPDRRWQIGVRAPDAADRLICVAESAGATATSGQYERMDHILDPLTGQPAHAARSATVSGASLAMADALATALIVRGPDALPAVLSAGYDALLIDPAGHMTSTPEFPLVAPSTKVHRGRAPDPSVSTRDCRRVKSQES